MRSLGVPLTVSSFLKPCRFRYYETWLIHRFRHIIANLLQPHVPVYGLLHAQTEGVVLPLLASRVSMVHPDAPGCI